jgi:hypothetical protein
MKVVVTQNGVELAKGKLTVDTSKTPPTATFKPHNGTEVSCSVSAWSTLANGAVGFSFTVSNSPNGDFPLGPGGTSFTYSFTGTENANGKFPSGGVTWPETSSIKDGGGDPPVWQSEADSEDEPISLGTAAC